MILVTGGAGYIGSHICLELLNAGHAVVVFDNLANSSVEALRRVEAICGRPIAFQNGDLRDSSAIGRLFSEYPIEAVIHLAGLKSVEDSVRRPLSYFDNNVKGALHLLSAHGKGRGEEIGFQLVSDRLWRAAIPAVNGRTSVVGHQPVWPHETDGRGHFTRPSSRIGRLEHRDPAILQSRRSS